MFNEDLLVDSVVDVDKELTHYMINVLRLRNGAHVILFNNSNKDFVCQLSIVTNKVQITVLSSVDVADKESPLQLYLAMSIVRSDRFDWVIQKSTELGVAGIYPITSKYTQVKTNAEQLEKRLNHWNKIAISSCEQCGRAKLPQIFPPMPLTQLLMDQKESNILALCTENNQKEQVINPITSLRENESIDAKDRIICLVGPEGGWQNEELEFFEQRQLLQLSLGSRILRSETAAISAVVLMQSFFGDLGN